MSSAKALLTATSVLIVLFVSVHIGYAQELPDSLNVIDSALAHSPLLDGKVVYVDFWASWCVPCRVSFPWMKKMVKANGERGFAVVAVNVDKEHQAAVKFLDASDPPFAIIYDSTGSLAKRYKLDALPTSFLYGRDGRLLSRHQGFHPDDTLQLDSLIQAALKAKQVQ